VLLGRGHGVLRRRAGHAAALLAAAIATSSPQLVLAWRDAGSPFASHQAKNVWFGLHGRRDWTLHWDGAPDDVSLLDVVGQSPWAFLAHLSANLGHFALQCVTWPFGVAPEAIGERARLALGPALLAAAALFLGWDRGAAGRLREVVRRAAGSAHARLCAAATIAYAAAARGSCG
jgi:hypothetical protein